MKCKACNQELPEAARFCYSCGKEQNPTRSRKKRGNGQGSVIKLPNGKYKAVATLYYVEVDGKRRRKTKTKTFSKRSDAVAALPELKKSPERKKTNITFQQLYDRWLPTHRAGKDTMNCYKAAYKHFAPVWGLPIADIDVDDLQECLDNCGHGKRTKQNMKALAGLMYKYGIPRQHIPENLNLGPYLIVEGEDAAHRESFTDIQIEKIRRQIGKTTGADYVYCLIYLGFRPSEFLALKLEDYDAANRAFTGGAKTEAGISRKVTISPKIQPYITAIAGTRRTGPFFADGDKKHWKLKSFTEDLFYPVLEAAGIDNPMVEIGGGKLRHKYTPHSCRHTFATLLKKVEAADKDKLELIGHTSEEQLRYYQDVRLEDLRQITDII